MILKIGNILAASCQEYIRKISLLRNSIELEIKELHLHNIASLQGFFSFCRRGNKVYILYKFTWHKTGFRIRIPMLGVKYNKQLTLDEMTWDQDSFKEFSYIELPDNSGMKSITKFERRKYY